MKTIATFPIKPFQAAAMFAPAQDIRYYLNGIHLERAASGEFYIVSTDGFTLFAHRLTVECDQAGPWALTIPCDKLALFLKTKPVLLLLQALDDGTYALSDGCGFSVQFAPVDGKFPDWRRVVPSKASVTGEAAQFNSDYIARAHKAMALMDGVKTKDAGFHGELHHNGPGSAVFVGHGYDTVIVLMPRRASTEKNKMTTDWFSPSPYFANK